MLPMLAHPLAPAVAESANVIRRDRRIIFHLLNALFLVQTCSMDKQNKPDGKQYNREKRHERQQYREQRRLAVNVRNRTGDNACRDNSGQRLKHSG
ncbi:MAG: hypothetical protein P8173_14325 [Gammaproteobacteria bacterium]